GNIDKIDDSLRGGVDRNETYFELQRHPQVRHNGGTKNRRIQWNNLCVFRVNSIHEIGTKNPDRQLDRKGIRFLLIPAGPSGVYGIGAERQVLDGEQLKAVFVVDLDAQFIRNHHTQLAVVRIRVGIPSL